MKNWEDSWYTFMVSTSDAVNEVGFCMEFLLQRRHIAEPTMEFSASHLKYSPKNLYIYSLNFSKVDFVMVFFPLIKL